ncbi:uncharacterized protein LOC127242930 [Andrographis paniculata]|uniref:uncharacterized protein LOC127242930 n=1 Tax=Andrographis paniculata TaxID=175694 RepID=UPI0021E8A47A|nr:uncharacterized protein LOC127242930 [Andrographis paniculata]
MAMAIVFPLFFAIVSAGKVCTNTGLGLPSPSHTYRYQLFSSNNSSIDFKLIPATDRQSSRRFLTAEDGGAHWDSLLSLKTDTRPRRDSELGFLKEISLHDVRLSPNSIHGVAQQTNLDYLLLLDVDRLVWSFRKTAGLETPGEPYGGWEAPDVELRGHFVGHYLSASAQMWASTHDVGLRQRMSSVVSALSECQQKIGSGYLSAFPSELFDRFEALQSVWAPYYTIHKILAGLLDQYSLAGSVGALKMAKWMVDYFDSRVRNVISKHTVERHWQSLNEETGGMNDVLYRLYAITGERMHLLLAHLFDKPCFLGLLAMKADDISGFHANTHIPIVIGAQRRYEVTGEPLYRDIGTFFMEIVNSSHSYATGGTSVSEFWTDPKRLASTLETENQESCTTYNMLKVSRHLFRWTQEMAYADYYERALTNGILGIQRGRDPGVMIYMLPLQPGGSKARTYHGWGTKFDSFWCCYGTGIETFAKLGDSIYFEEEGNVPRLYVTQYISSSLDWRSGRISLNQRVEPVVSWDQTLRVTLTVSSKRPAEAKQSTLKMRIPQWTYRNASKASLNGRDLSLPQPGTFLSITRSWIPGDRINLELRMSLRTEAIKDDRPEFASVHAVLYGPYVLAGLSNGDWDMKVGTDCITPVPSHYNSHLITLSQEFNGSSYVLTNSEHVIKAQASPQPGTDAAVRATFRIIIVNNSQSENNAAGKLVMLEPFDYPGKVMVHYGNGEPLEISDPSEQSSVFRMIDGMDGDNGTVSLESATMKGCYVYGDAGSGSGVMLNCSGAGAGARFVVQEGMMKYDPMSFVGKGVKRNFVMVPLYSLRDESYTVYFNTT